MKKPKLPSGICYEDGMILLIRCPKCNRENYAINVAIGICTWCGYDANKDPEITKLVKNETR